MHRQRNASCTLSDCCDVVLVTAKTANIRPDPEESGALVMEAEIERRSLRSRRIVEEIPACKKTQPVKTSAKLKKKVSQNSRLA
jgi:hypothetical protein